MGWDAEVAKHNNPKAIPKSPLQTIMTGFAEPLDTVADMSHLIDSLERKGKGKVSLDIALADSHGVAARLHGRYAVWKA